MRTLPHITALVCLGTILSAGGCTISHQGRPRLAPLDSSWGEAEDGPAVWQQNDVRVIASRAWTSLEFPFGGRISNLQDAPVRVEFRPIGVDVPPDRAIGDVARGDDPMDRVPFFVGEAFDVAPHDARRNPDPHALWFGLHRTQGREGPRPFAPDDVVERHVTPSGVVVSQYPGAARVGDEAHYELLIYGDGGVVVCPYHVRLVEGREIVDFPWWKWPIAVLLAPIGIPLLLSGAGH